jgi:hypothetical protein
VSEGTSKSHMTFRVVYDDGREVESVAKPKDIVAFERQYGVSMAAAFADESQPPPLEWLFYLAWSPLHRLKQDPRAFDEFLDDVDSIEALEDAEEAAPFPPEASVEPSPS